MKYLLLLFLITIISFGINAQTNVSGGIYANTTWTFAASPYIVVDTVVVFPGVTLIIEPGVIVKFENNKRMDVRGTLIAQGTVTDSITFTSNSASPTMGIWNEIFFTGSHSILSYCNIRYAFRGIFNYEPDTMYINNSTFNYNTSAILSSQRMIMNSCTLQFNNVAIGYGGGVWMNFCLISYNQTGINGCEQMRIKNSVINYNSVVGVKTAQMDSVYNCEIKFNGIGLDDETSGGGTWSDITNNVIESNDIGILLGYYGDKISCNRVCNNTTYDLKYTRTQNTNCVRNNYWCSSDSATIAAHIYDGYDNSSFGLVTFFPIDTLQCYLSVDIPVIESENLPLTLYPNPTTSNFTLKNISSNETSLLQIINPIGEIVYTEKLFDKNEYVVDGNFAKGIYFVRLSDGEKNVVRKLVIE